MYDPTFHRAALSREFLKRDSKLGDAIKTAALEVAANSARAGFQNLQFSVGTPRGKKIFHLKSLADNLLLRRITRNVRHFTRARQQDRNAIVRAIKAILQEGIAYRVYKLDIRNFYETISVDVVLKQLEGEPFFPKDTARLLRSFFENTKNAHVLGLPRGLALSAALSEYVMSSFDRAIKADPDVYFYARYVDDIFVLTKRRELPRVFLKKIRETLCEGLSLNQNKCEYVDLNDAGGARGQVPESFDFLGYKFTVASLTRSQGGRKKVRKVSLEISDKKIKKIKTRIVKTFLTFLTDRNFVNLIDRLKLLSSNYNFFDKNKSVRRNAGLYCNYRFLEAESSDSLQELDRFLRSQVLSRTSPLASRVAAVLTQNQKDNILSISFKRRFALKTFHHYSAARLSELVRCWAYV